MPFVDDNKFNLLLKRLENIERKISSINGTPLIHAYSSKKFVLNEHLDVIFLNKKLDNIDKSIKQILNTTNELIIKNPFFLTSYCKITAFLDGNDIEHPGIRIELSKDNGKTWEQPVLEQIL